MVTGDSFSIIPIFDISNSYKTPLSCRTLFLGVYYLDIAVTGVGLQYLYNTEGQLAKYTAHQKEPVKSNCNRTLKKLLKMH